MEKAKVLIIEDEVIVAHDLADMLTQWGYEVMGIVSSGEEAVGKAKETNPDLVLADIKLKGKMDGIEASHRIRANSDVAIVYLTARTESDLFDRAKKQSLTGISPSRLPHKRCSARWRWLSTSTRWRKD